MSHRAGTQAAEICDGCDGGTTTKQYKKVFQKVVRGSRVLQTPLLVLTRHYVNLYSSMRTDVLESSSHLQCAVQFQRGNDASLCRDGS